MDTSRDTAPGFIELRAAARAVRSAEHGRSAYTTVRPRGVTGILRARGPLALALLVARREGRLVWRDRTTFALLVPPLADRPVPGRGPGHRVLGAVDRHWELVLFAGPPGLALMSATAMLPTPALWPVALALALATMIYVSVLMLGMVVTALSWFVRTFGRRPADGERAAEVLPAYRYSMPLCHCVDPGAADDLLDRVGRRLNRLVESDMVVAASQRGAMLDSVRIVTALTCLTRGVTTDALRRHLARTDRVARPFGAGGEVVLLKPRDQAPEPPARFASTARFFLWYVFGLAAVLLICAWIVAQRESAVCAAACAGRPATYEDAVRWLFGAGGDLRPATSGTWMFGTLATIARWLTIPVAGIAVLQVWRQTRHDQVLADQADRVIARQPRVLLVVVTQVEFDAVVAVAREWNPERAPWMDYRVGQPVLRLGEFGGCDVSLARSGPGPESSRGLRQILGDLLADLRPRYVVLTGICFGLKEGEEEIGDVVLASQVRDIEHRKLAERDGVVDEQPRGDWLGPSPDLFGRMSVPASTWSRSAVHIGPMVGSATLYNSRSRRAEVVAAHPDAYAGDMECHVFGAVAVRRRVDWCVVRGISDLGMDKRDDAQRTAATNAARLVFDVITSRALADPADTPRRPPPP